MLRGSNGSNPGCHPLSAAWHGWENVGETTFGEYFVSRDFVYIEGGSGVIKRQVYYGPGRKSHTAAGERLVAHWNEQENWEWWIKKGIYYRTESLEEANRNNFRFFVSAFQPMMFKGSSMALNSLNKVKSWIPEGLNKIISFQKQQRHLSGTAEAGKGFLLSLEDAQAVLDAVHSGAATYLGKTSQGHLLVKFEGVTGVNVNVGAGYLSQPTNTFIIKGTSSVSVVPTAPR